MKRFKKKVTRITGILILSLGLFISPLFASSPKAASSTTVTSYGQYYYESGYENANFMYQLTESWLFKNISACSYITFAYDFKDTYDGYVNLTVSAAQSFAWQNIHFYCEGAVFTQQPNMTNSSATKSFQVHFQSSRGFKVVLFDTSGSVFNSSSKITVGTSNFNLQPNIADELDALHTSWDYYVPGMSTSLANISNNTSTMTSDIAILKSYVDQLEGYVDNLEPYLNNLIQLQQYSSYFPSYNLQGYLWGVSYGGYSNYYGSSIPFATVGSSVNDSSYTNIHRIMKSKDSDCVLYFISDYWVSDSHINILWQDTRFNSSYHVEVKQWYSSDNPNAYHALYLCKLTVVSNNTFDNGFEIEFNLNQLRLYPLYIGTPDMLPDDLALLLGIDFNNTYTRLLTSIDSGIQAIASNPNVINNTETIINNYETTFNTVNNVENNVTIDFDPQLTIVNQSISDSGVLSPTSDIVNTGSWVSYIVGFTDSIPMFKIPLYAILVLFVAACLLG